MKKKPLLFAILDGWGVGPKDKSINAIAAAKTPFFDEVIKDYPYTQLGATGVDVGLEENQMSGSESGHLNIGAGRVVEQDVRIILEAISNGSFFKNPVFLGAINHAKRFNSKVHFAGLLGDKDSPHAHPDILLALIVLFKKNNLEDRTFLHLFTDGRDSFPRSALEHWSHWKNLLEKDSAAKCATLCGRFYAMDRTKKWDRLMKAYDAMVYGKGEKYSSVEEAVNANYKKDNTDEYLEPSILVENGQPVAKIEDNDVVIFFNFRSDRARQFSKFFVGTETKKEKDFPEFPHLKNLFFVAMTDFGPDLQLQTAFPSDPITSTLPVALSEIKQLYISETEKFAHITYFINGGYSAAIAGEDRIMVDSPDVKSYAEEPEMSAKHVTDTIEKNLKYDVYDFIAVNYANADMVGHTGDFAATIKAVECVDSQLLRLHKALKKKDGTLVISADHGNADVMVDKKAGRLFTFHTKNPVPFCVVSKNAKRRLSLESGGVLGNITPTILDLLEISQPKEMEKDSLII